VHGRTTLVGVDWRARLIGKGLTIGTLVLLLSGLYIILLAALAPRLDVPGMPFGHTLAAVLIATLVVPVRNRLGLVFNRLMYRDWQTTQALLRDVGAALGRTISLDRIHAILVDDLPQRLRLQGATLWMLEPPHDQVFVMVGRDDARLDRRLLVNGAIARRLSAEPNYLLLPAEGVDTEWLPLSEQGVRLALPLHVGNQLIGIYGCAAPVNGRLYPERVINVLLMLAPAVASALENARAYSKIARLNRELRELDQMKAEFIQSVGHELRTPLTTLSLAIQLLDRQAGMPQSLASITRTGVAQIQALVDRVLAFDLGLDPPTDIQPPLLPIRLAPLLEEIVEAYLPIAAAKGVRFGLHIGAELAVMAYIPSLCRALHEVVDNAVRYSEGGTVTLAAQPHDGHVLLSIADEGPGIPQEEHDRLFEAFYRGSGTRALSGTPGTGLGLSIARRDIEAFGGQIWLEDSGPSGSTICVAIPAASPADAPPPAYERAVNA